MGFLSVSILLPGTAPADAARRALARAPLRTLPGVTPTFGNSLPPPQPSTWTKAEFSS